MLFEELNVNKEIVSALKEMGITTPTMIQEKAIPLIKAGKDLIGMSKTGSGKTAAFGIPVLEKIVPGKGLQAAILAPTRELAVQISREMQKFGKKLKFSIATVYGGVSLDPQAEKMARSEILVGTPGRTLDHLRRGNLNLSCINMMVLDEADKMVEMGFIEDVEEILNHTPEGRQVLLFGATLSEDVNRIRQRFMRDPEVAEAEKQVEGDLLKQYYYNIEPHDKFSLLVHLLNKDKEGKAIIFCSARSTVEILTRNLRKNGIKTEMIHGKLSQNRRLRVIDGFSKGYPSILVASAVAARGIDIKDVTQIFNYDLSRDPQEYIHRVGRTARAGEAGKAITLLCHKDYEAFDEIFRRYSVNVEELQPGEFPRLRFDARRAQTFGGRSRFGGRGRFGMGQRNMQRGGWNDRQNDRPRSWGNQSRHNGGGSGRAMWKVEKVNTAN